MHLGVVGRGVKNTISQTVVRKAVVEKLFSSAFHVFAAGVILNLIIVIGEDHVVINCDGGVPGKNRVSVGRRMRVEGGQVVHPNRVLSEHPRNF